MPNLTFGIKKTSGSNGSTVVVGIKATVDSLFKDIEKVILEAVQEGERVARAEAPHGKSLGHLNRGQTIADAVRSSPGIEYRPGGAGGGGQYQAEFYVDGAIAPHLKYVWEGTGDKSGEKTEANRIYPARGNLFSLDKGGEGSKVVRWISGQKPQQEWWERAQEAAQSEVRRGIRGISVINQLRNLSQK